MSYRSAIFFFFIFFFFYLSFLFSYKGYKECNIFNRNTMFIYFLFFNNNTNLIKRSGKGFSKLQEKNTSDAPGKKRKQTPTILKFLVGKGDNCQKLLFLIFLFGKYLEGSESRRGILY